MTVTRSFPRGCRLGMGRGSPGLGHLDVLECGAVRALQRAGLAPSPPVLGQLIIGGVHVPWGGPFSPEEV